MKTAFASRFVKRTLPALFALGASTALSAQEVRRESLTDVADLGRTVDMLWVAPDKGDGPWPTILFVHGFQFPAKWGDIPPGAAAMLEPEKYPLFEMFREKGFLVAAVSQAGYGRTDGPMDFCGPFSQQAIATAIAFLRENPSVRDGQLFLHGRSRGAMASSMAAARPLDIAGVILESGIYDLETEYARLAEFETEPQIYIAANIRNEGGAYEDAFRARSLLMTDLSIPAPVLILHGEADTNTPIDSARRLERHLSSRGAEVRLVTVPGEGHTIEVSKSEAAINAFIADALENAR